MLTAPAANIKNPKRKDLLKKSKFSNVWKPKYSLYAVNCSQFAKQLFCTKEKIGMIVENESKIHIHTLTRIHIDWNLFSLRINCAALVLESNIWDLNPLWIAPITYWLIQNEYDKLKRKKKMKMFEIQCLCDFSFS